MSDPAVDAAIAAGQVPSSITAEYLNESRDRPAIISIIFVTALATVIFVARCLSRIFLLSRFSWDDILATVSWTTFIPFTALCIKLINLGSGRHFAYIQHVLDLETVNQTEVLDFVAHLIYTSSLAICRLSGLALYGAICRQNRKYFMAIRIICCFIIISYLAQFLLIVFHCVPVTGLWPYEWQPEVDNYTCLTWGVVYSVNSAVSLFSDMLLYGVPIVMIWRLQLPHKRKIQLACILLPGILVTAISVTRLVLVIRGQWLADMSWSYNPMLAVEVSEIGGTLISLSIPGVKPLVDKLIFNKTPTTKRQEYNSGSHSHSTAFRKFRSTHSRPAHDKPLDNSPESAEQSADQRSMNSRKGILVKSEYAVELDAVASQGATQTPAFRSEK